MSIIKSVLSKEASKLCCVFISQSPILSKHKGYSGGKPPFMYLLYTIVSNLLILLFFSTLTCSCGYRLFDEIYFTFIFMKLSNSTGKNMNLYTFFLSKLYEYVVHTVNTIDKTKREKTKQYCKT